MKKIVYPFLFLFFTFSLAGQVCTPEPDLPDDFLGVYPRPFVEDDPESGIRTEACIGEEYLLTLTVFVPAEYDLGFGFPLLIEEVRLIAVEGLPAGLEVECNRADCIYPSEMTDCLALKGIPSAANAPGDYDLLIKMTAKTNINPNLPLEFPGILAPGKYTIKLNPEGDAACGTVPVSESRIVAPLLLYPNPAQDKLYLAITGNQEIDPSKGDLFLIISDITGAEKMVRPLHHTEARNEIEIGLLSPGLHLLQIADSAGNILMRSKFVKI